MKALLIAMLVVGAAFAAAWYGGLFAMEDPVEQSKKMREVAAKPGATWEDIAAVRAPRKYATVNRDRRLGHDDPVPFERETFAAAVKDGQSPQGYMFEYAFSADINYQVYVDSKGKVAGVRDLVTMKDLLEGTALQKQAEHDMSAPVMAPAGGGEDTADDSDEDKDEE